MNCEEKYCVTSRLSSCYFLCEILQNVTVCFGEMMATFEWCLSQQPVSLSSCCYMKPIDHPVMTIGERNLCCYFWFCYSVACLHWHRGTAYTERLFFSLSWFKFQILRADFLIDWTWVWLSAVVQSSVTSIRGHTVPCRQGPSATVKDLVTRQTFHKGVHYKHTWL